jgi:hypothetical protein
MNGKDDGRRTGGFIPGANSPGFGLLGALVATVVLLSVPLVCAGRDHLGQPRAYTLILRRSLSFCPSDDAF